MTSLERFDAQPRWPDTDGPVLFLLDANTRLEERLLTHWIEVNTPPNTPSADVGIAKTPQSRRRKRDRSLDPRLQTYLNLDADPLLVPLRVVWLAPERDGERVARLRDLATIGDPRDPDPVRQHYLLRAHPERLRIVAGEPARVSALRERWGSPGAIGRIASTTLGDYVALQAWLALERAERRQRGNRYKVPKFVSEDLTSRRSFAVGISEIAEETGKSFDALAADSLRYLKEIAAKHSPYAIDVMAGATRWLMDRAYSGFHYDAEQLAELYEHGQRHPLIFLPSHKSNFDTLVLQYALYENELPPNHTAAGINMNFFPVGLLIRRVGYFFIRRTFKDNPTYKFVLQAYLEYLLGKRFPLEWYIEGGRSRSGKLREPRFGLLGYVIDAYHRSVTDNVVLIPVSIAYDQIQDVRDYADEQRGLGKESESLQWAVKTIRRLRNRYGAIHLRFGEPIELREALGPANLAHVGDRLITQKVAFKVAANINNATPITPISLVALALLSVGDRALTVTETMAVLEPFLEYVRHRDLPTTVPLALDTPERVQNALDDLVSNGVVARHNGATATVYGIGHQQHLSAAYYRNTIIHFFVNSSIVELALLHAARSQDSGASSPKDEFWSECTTLRDVLKFEFFFAERAEYQEEIAAEMRRIAPDWEQQLDAGSARDLLVAARPFRSSAVLKPFLEAYRIVADAIAIFPPDSVVDKAELLEASIALGKQYEAQRKIQSVESVSTVLFDSAIKLAAHRGILEPSTTRSRFASDITAIVSHLYALEALEAGLEAGITT